MLLLIPITAASATSTDPSEIDGAIRFRTEAGFRSDRVFVETTFRDDSSFTDTKWGLPLSRDEDADLETRILSRDKIEPALQWAASQPDHADVFFDQQRKGLAVFLFKGDTTKAQDELRTRIPTGIVYEVRSVDRSLEDLYALKAKVHDAQRELEAMGTSVTRIGLDIKTNTVVVGVRDLTGAKAETVGSRFGSGVTVVDAHPAFADACVSVTDCWPAKGGIHIYANGNVGHKCTSGFLVRRSDTGVLMMVTAGHCIQAWGGYNVEWKHSGARFGFATLETFSRFTQADVGLISVWYDPPARNTVLVSSSNPSDPGATRQVSYVKPTAQQVVGDWVCRMGVTSGRDCGTITRVDEDGLSCDPVPEPDLCYWVHHTNVVSFDSLGGDSGGPYFAWSPYACCIYAYGTHVHSEEGVGANAGWYSPVEWGIIAFNTQHPYSYWLCTDTDC